VTTQPVVYVAAKRSQYQKYVVDHPDPRAIELLRHHDAVVARWRKADREHRRTHDQVLQLLTRLGVRVVSIEKPHGRFDPRSADLVVTVGGDGTLLAASHYVGSQPVLGVNSSPEHSVGYFCAAHPSNLEEMLTSALQGSLRGVRLMRMRVDLNGELRAARVLNEALYSHQIPAAVSRYILRLDHRSEEQRSSGLWIGTAAGSTGALRSAGGAVLPLGSRRLQLVVREPYAPPGSKIRVRRHLISHGEFVEVQSKMDHAILFLDGPYRRVVVRLGDVLRFSASEDSLTVLGLGKSRNRLTE
jgi:NAD+ kinase